MGLPLRIALGLAARLHDGQAAFEFRHAGIAVFLCDVARRLAVEVKAVRRIHQRLDVARARGVAVQEYRQRLLAEKPRRAQLDVGLDAQLDGQQTPGSKKRREVLGQQGGAGGGRQVGRRGG